MADHHRHRGRPSRRSVVAHRGAVAVRGQRDPQAEQRLGIHTQCDRHRSRSGRHAQLLSSGGGLMSMCGCLVWAALSAAIPATRDTVKDTLPTQVAAAFHHTYPAARILNVSKERSAGRVVYEIESQDGDTRRDLIYTPSG